MNEKKISVIVPIFNGEKYLRRCIESILKQTYKNIELILINDGSEDKSLAICEEYKKNDKRIIIINKENEGVSIARNIGIEKATGELISFVDADDYLEITFLQELFDMMKKYNTEYITCGYNRVYDNHIEQVNNDLKEILMTADEYLKKLLNVQAGHGFAHMKLIDKNIIGNIRFDENLKVGEDALFNVMLCQNLDNVVIFNKPLYNYYFNPNSVVRKFDKNYYQKYLESMEKMTEYIKNKYINNYEIEQNLQNYISYHILLISVNYCYHPENRENNRKKLKEVCEEKIFKKAIKESNYNDMSITRKISLFALKHKMYLIMGLICKIRQKQFKQR